MIPNTPHDRLDRDDRAVSEILGAIFVFALIISVLAFIQVWAVPAANQQTEFEHNQRTLGDFQQLGSEVDRAAALGISGSTPVEVGTRYQTRFFLLNPPSPTGTLNTEAGTIELRNAAATNAETRDYLDGGARTFETRSLTYRPNYNEYGNAPETHYEGWTLYNDFDGTKIAYDREGLLSGRTIRLTALDGTVSEATQRSAIVQTNPVSAPAQSVSVRGESPSEPVTVAITTGLDAANWTERLSGEPYFARATQIDDDTVEIELEYAEGGDPITYDLRMAKVGLGTGATNEEPHYLTANGPPDLDSSGGVVTVDVRDRFNAPVSGASVDFTATGADLSASTVTSDENGHATVEVERLTGGSTTITATTTVTDGPNRVERETVVFEDGSGGGEGTTDPGSEVNPNDPDSLTLESATKRQVGPGQNRRWVVDVTFRNRGGAKEITATRLNAYVLSTFSQATPPVPDTVQIDGSAHVVGGPYIDQPDGSFTTDIESGAAETYSFEFSDGGSNYQPDNGDFFVFSVRTEEGATSRYFVQPR